jgi:ribonuclease HI
MSFNPGVTKLGGIILNPEGKEENVYAWGLEKASNNQMEKLTLYQGLRIIDERQNNNIVVIEDSKLKIRSLHKGIG